MKRKPSVSPGVWTCVGLVLAVILWEAAAAAGHVNLFFFSCPSQIWAEFLEMLNNGTMASHLSTTLKEAGLGLLLGGVLGTATGLTLGTHPRLSRALMPLMTGLNGLPKLALGPLIIIWFGLGIKSKVIMSALMVFFIFTFNLYSGVLSVERELITAVKLLGGTRQQVMRKVIWPASIPWLLTSLRTALGLSISGAIVGEYLGASKGMGWVLAASTARFDVGRVLCCVAVIVVIVVLGDAVVRLLERKLLRWR
ncbi:MAG: ABC transporter permease [Ruminiclostridium sp.]|nr:ABC transporter permease [Ruminiclostridium sp.]